MALTWNNTRGLHGGKIVQDLFTTTKTAAVIGLIFLGLLVAWNAEVFSANLTAFWDAARRVPPRTNS